MSEGRMRIAVRIIYHLPVTPSMHVIDLDTEAWRRFLYASSGERREIVLDLVGHDNLSHKIREMAWIPLSGQDKLSVVNESDVI